MGSGTRRRPLGGYFRFRLGLRRRALVVDGGGLLLPLAFLLHATILKPDLDLSFGEVERERHLYARRPTEVLAEAELSLELHQLVGRERRPRSLATTRSPDVDVVCTQNQFVNGSRSRAVAGQTQRTQRNVNASKRISLKLELKLELKMFCQTHTARKPLIMPVTVHSRHPRQLQNGPVCYCTSFAAYGARLTKNSLSMGMTQQFFRLCPWRF